MRNIDINIYPSKQFRLLIAIVLIATLIIIFTLAISIWLKLLLIVLAGSYSLLQHRKPIIQLRFHDDQWIIRDKTREYTAELCGSSTITKFCSILIFQIKNERFKRSCIIFRDSLQPDYYRKMIALCLW
jgi:hypothetical protein